MARLHNREGTPRRRRVMPHCSMTAGHKPFIALAFSLACPRDCLSLWGSQDDRDTMTTTDTMRHVTPDQETTPMGVVLRRAPGVTRWAKWSWTATDLLPGAAPASGQVLREVEGITWIHAATCDTTLHVSDTEAYVHELQTREPSLYVIMRRTGGDLAAAPKVIAVTASPYEAQDYADNGEDIVERIAMPDAVRTWIEAFVARHHVETPFVKRRRDSHRDDGPDRLGDARIATASDVYRTPTAKRRSA